MYLRRWTKVPFHQGMKLYRETYHVASLEANPILQFEPIDYQRGYELRSELQDNQQVKLIKRLFEKYPELKFLPLASRNRKGDYMNENIAIQFIRKQKHFMSQGFNEKKSFELSEQVYQEQMQKKINSQLVSNNLATSNNARSFMTYYQQQSEYESRLKVQRIKRDMYLQEVEKKQLLEQEEKFVYQESDVKKEDPLYDSLNKYYDDLQSKYQKTLYRIMAPGQKDPNQSQKDVCDDLISRTNNLFTYYYKRAAVKDRLYGLTDQQIQQSILGQPKKIKNSVSRILKKLDKYGVTFNENRDLIIPAKTPEKVRQLLQTKEFQAALMYRDISYEQKHKMHIDVVQRKLQQLREDTKVLQKSLEIDMNEETKIQTEQYISNVIQNSKINIPQESTYQLFEVQEERLMRLEIKWWERQQKLLEIQGLEEQLKENPDPQRVEEMNKKKQASQTKIEDIIEKLRYVKFQLEQENIKETSKTIFDEHSILLKTYNTFKKAGSIKVDDLEHYFSLPFEKRKLTKHQLENDENIQNLIRRVNLEEGIADLSRANPQNYIQKEEKNERMIKRIQQIDAEELEAQKKLDEQYHNKVIQVESGEFIRKDDIEGLDSLLESVQLEKLKTESKKFWNEQEKLEQNIAKTRNAETDKNKKKKK